MFIHAHILRMYSFEFSEVYRCSSRRSGNRITMSQIKTVIWQKECCIWHIIVSRSLLAAKSHQPNRMETYFPLLKMVKHLDLVISTSIENCFRLWSFSTLQSRVSTNTFTIIEHQLEFFFMKFHSISYSWIVSSFFDLEFCLFVRDSISAELDWETSTELDVKLFISRVRCILNA